jgi:N-acetyl-beta-hexosaminidase
MGQMLQWPEYAHLRDNTEVFLAESEATYEFLEKLIQTISSPFRSKRIHIGMDEVS